MNVDVCKDTIASNTIPNTNITVNVNSNNTVNTIINNISEDIIFNNGWTDYISAIYDSNNNKVIIAYSDTDNNGYGTVVVGTVTGNNITFNTPVVFNKEITSYISTIYSTVDNKVIITYSDEGNNSYGTAIVGTVSGDNILFGDPIIFSNASTSKISTTYDTLNNKIVIAYRNDGNDYFGTAIVGTVINNSIIFGSPTIFNNDITWTLSAVYDTFNNKVVIAYNRNVTDWFGVAIVGTVSGDSISFKHPTVFNNNVTTYISTTYDTNNNKIIIAYCDDTNNEFGTVIVGTVTDDSIVFGNPTVFSDKNTWYISTVCNITNNKVVIVYNSANNNGSGNIIVGTIADNSIVFESPIMFNNTNIYYISTIYDMINDKVIIAYSNNNNINENCINEYGIIKVFEPNTNS